MKGQQCFLIKHKVFLILKKVLLALFVIFVEVTVTFFLMHLVSGDPFSSSVDTLTLAAKEQYIEYYGLNKPLIQQYFIFLSRLLNGDLGTSMVNRTSTVNDVIRSFMPVSIILGGISVCGGTIIGYMLGVFSAYIKKESVRKWISTFCLIGISLPVFVWAPWLQSVFAVRLNWFPISGWWAPKCIILPVICLLPNTIATIMKYTRDSVISIRKSQYYLASKQRGFSEQYVFWHHIFKNSLPSVVTVLVSSLSGIFSGAFIVEKIFSIPGIGREYMFALNMRDYTMIIGLNIIFTIIYLLFRLLGDIFQQYCNPLFAENSHDGVR